MDLFDFLFPRKCHICNVELTDGEKFVCAPCIAKLPRTRYHTMKLNPMEEKLVGGVPFERGTGHFFYAHGSSVARLIYDFKYNRYPSLAVEMGKLIANELLPTGFFSGVEVLQPVVMNTLRRASRGYNQAEMLARGVSAATGLPLADNLRASFFHISQTSKGRLEREKNVKGAFRVVYPEELRNKGILVIDDVCTTGATMRNASEALSKADGVKIYYLAMACV